MPYDHSKTARLGRSSGKRRDRAIGRRTLLLALGVSVILGSFGCSYRPRLYPAPEIQESAEAIRAAAVENDGVRARIETQAWFGDPPRLTQVTPILVSIQNRSDSSVRITYDDIKLLGPSEERLFALPPFQINETQSRRYGSPIQPYYSALGFYIIPPYAPYYPIYPQYGPVTMHDPFYYDRYYPELRRVRLPTIDMLSKALPEGILEPGGSIKGFVYFQKIPREYDRTTLVIELTDPETGGLVTDLRVPLVVTS